MKINAEILLHKSSGVILVAKTLTILECPPPTIFAEPEVYVEFGTIKWHGISDADCWHVAPEYKLGFQFG